MRSLATITVATFSHNFSFVDLLSGIRPRVMSVRQCSFTAHICSMFARGDAEIVQSESKTIEIVSVSQSTDYIAVQHRIGVNALQSDTTSAACR